MSRITPSNPANTLTPAYSTVSSPAGFQSGDLVYYKDSSFGPIPGNAVSSASFNINSTVNLGQNAVSPVVNWASYNPNGPVGSTNARAPSAARLSNGNIVVVYTECLGSGPQPAGYKIIDQNGAVVVANTAFGYNVGALFGHIGVAALAGGGFAVALYDDAVGSVAYGVFSNTGTVVTAFQNDSHIGTSFCFDIKPLLNGGFVIAGNATPSFAGQYRTRVYTSTGAAGTASTVTAWNNNVRYPIIGVYNDDSFGVLIPISSTAISLFRFSTTGSFVNSVAVTTTWSSNGNYDFIVPTDNLGRAFHVDSATLNRTILNRITSAGAVTLSGPISSTNYTQSINAAPLSGGGYVYTRPSSTTGAVVLVRANSGDSQVSSVVLPGFGAYVPNTNGGQLQRTTIVEGSTWLTLLDNTGVSSSYTFGSLPFIQVNKSDVNTTGIRGRFPTASVTGSAVAPVSGYARGGSTPNAASFLASNTQTLSRTINASSGTDFALTPFVAVTDAVTWQSMVEMNNGQFVIVYRTTAGSIRFSVFNQNGSFVSNTIVSANGTASPLVRCTCLGNGKLVISWVPTANNDIFFVVYSTSYVQLATGLASAVLGTIFSPGDFNTGGPGHDIGPFGDNNFVVGLLWNGGSTTSVVVFNDSAVYQNRSDITPGTGINVQIASDSSGIVTLRCNFPGNPDGSSYSFVRGNSATSLIFYDGRTNGNSTAGNFNEGLAMMPNGMSMGFIATGTTRRLWRSAPVSGYDTTGFGSLTTGCAAAICAGQGGEAVALVIASGTSSWYTIAPNMDLASFSTTVGQSVISSNGITINDGRVGTIGCRPQIANLYDNIYVFSYITTDSTIKVGFLCTVTTTYSSGITAGVTPSLAAITPSPANGYYLAGVSASECAAGGTGVLQVNGAATLNSQYPAGTPSQAFDFNTPALDVGVRGTIAGRNMIISGGK